MAFLTFLVLTAVGGVLEGLILAMPLSGVRHHLLRGPEAAGPLVRWAMYLMADVFFHYGTGLNWTYIFATFSWEQTGTPVYVVTAWIQVLVTLALLIATVHSFRREPFPPTRRTGSSWRWYGPDSWQAACPSSIWFCRWAPMCSLSGRWRR